MLTLPSCNSPDIILSSGVKEALFVPARMAHFLFLAVDGFHHVYKLKERKKKKKHNAPQPLFFLLSDQIMRLSFSIITFWSNLVQLTIAKDNKELKSWTEEPRQKTQSNKWHCVAPSRCMEGSSKGAENQVVWGSSHYPERVSTSSVTSQRAGFKNNFSESEVSKQKRWRMDFSNYWEVHWQNRNKLLLLQKIVTDVWIIYMKWNVI